MRKNFLNIFKVRFVSEGYGGCGLRTVYDEALYSAYKKRDKLKKSFWPKNPK